MSLGLVFLPRGTSVGSAAGCRQLAPGPRFPSLSEKHHGPCLSVPGVPAGPEFACGGQPVGENEGGGTSMAPPASAAQSITQVSGGLCSVPIGGFCC